MSMPMSTCIAQFNSVYSHMLVSHSKDDGEGRDGAVGGRGGGCGTVRRGMQDGLWETRSDKGDEEVGG